jgi:hypothetical protein
MYRKNHELSQLTEITLRLLIVLFLAIGVGTAQAQFADIYVDAANGDNATADGSSGKPYKTITFALAKEGAIGTPDPWYLHIQQGTYDADPARPSIDREIFPLTLREGMMIEGTTAAQCIIDGQHIASPTFPIVFGTGLSNFVLRNLTIQNMKNRGVTLIGATGTVDGCVIRNNSSSGLYTNQGLTITNNTFSNNSNVDGGGLYVIGNFIGNVSGNTFSDNSGGWGGGFYMSASGNFTGDVSQNTFSNNSANGPGGGFYMNGTFSGNVSQNTFTSNSAGNDGGGFYLQAGTATVVNNLFIDNTAIRNGSAVFTRAACTFQNNLFTDDGTSTLNTVYLSSDQCQFHNNIFTGMQTVIYETGQFDLPITHNIFHNIGVDIVNRNGSGVGNSVLLMDLFLPGASNNIEGDPLFVDAANGDYHLQATSPAINAGDNANAPAVDRDGNTRPVNGVVDIGPYEFGGTAPAISVSPTPIDFGRITVGQPATQTVTVGNTGAAELVVSDITASGLGTNDTFTFSATNFTVQPGNSKNITLTLTKAAAGSINLGVITITSNDPSSPKRVNFSATTTASGSITGQFTVPLSVGLNLISLPVQPSSPMSAKDLANTTGATLILQLDAPNQRWLPFVPGVSTGNGFTLNGGEGYIINLLQAKQISFTGTVWDNTGAAPNPSPGELGPVWAFAVAGPISEDLHRRDASRIIVKNYRNGVIMQTSISGNTFAVSAVDPSLRPVVEVGDSLEIRLLDGADRQISEPLRVSVSPTDLRRAVKIVSLQPRQLPRQTLLLQNYPNPFNPETWIPYQLASSATVTLDIYDQRGALVRRLDIGHQPAGYYKTRDHAAYWDGRNDIGERVASGVYYYQLQATGDGEVSRSLRRMLILK